MLIEEVTATKAEQPSVDINTVENVNITLRDCNGESGKDNDKHSCNKENSNNNFPCMTSRELRDICLKHDGYSTPSLNDTLYLHFKGYRKIENLEAYTGLKALWLNSNGLLKIENLSTLKSLRCLFLQRNLVSEIENLDALPNLVQLDLSENQINHVSGLACLPNLNTLNLAKNALQNSNSIAHLKRCKALTTIDLSDNYLKGEDIIEILSSMWALIALNINGNPVVRETGYFRKKCIAKIKKLKYLDRPIFEIERATSEAWISGGREAELKTKKEWQETERRKHQEGLEVIFHTFHFCSDEVISQRVKLNPSQ